MANLRAGNLNATLTKPIMRLPYLVNLARFGLVAGPGIQPKRVWTFFNAPLRCDVYPLKDDIYFLQSGETNVAEVVFHFYYNQSILVHDRVKLQNIDQVVGPPGAWFELLEVFRPHDLLRYIRAFGKVIDAPSND